MKGKRLLELNDNLKTILKSLNEEVLSYEIQYQSYKDNNENNNNNNNNNLNHKKKTAETLYDAIDEIVQRNKIVLSIEEKMIEILSEFTKESSIYFASVKNEKREIEEELNEIIDEMMKENKEKNKENNKEIYNEKKEEIEKLYIETNEIIERRIEKEKRRKEKEEKQKINGVLENMCMKFDEEKFEKVKRKEDDEYDCELKIFLVGDTCTGAKTSLMIRYVDDEFYEELPTTIGTDFKIKTIESCGKRVKLQIVCYFYFELFESKSK